MHMACSARRYKAVECLLKLGADEKIKDRWHQTPLSLAITTKQQMMISILSSSTKAKLDLADPELALCSAAGGGDLTQVKRLLDFGIAPTLRDYDKRTALHVSAAEGHEKIVELLLLALADPNSKDRWGGTPLQDALSGGHISTAYLLKAKGAEVPESFGAGAVCEAAGKGDVPRLRMLHSFGQSLDVGDYDDRLALHLASAEGRVMAVSFLLGISSDPNRRDRWGGTPMDDCVRGDTLYHKYCAKLLQGWGGELGTFKGTPQGDSFWHDLENVSIASIREVIRKLIDQGLDKHCPQRMDDQQLVVVMSATARHMPLVTQLHTNTAIITKEIKHFRAVVHTFVNQIRENLELVLVTLARGSRRVPILDDGSLDVDKRALKATRPRTAGKARQKTREEMHQDVDTFTGIEQSDNSQILDSLLLESPAHSHSVVGPPNRMMRWFKRLGKNVVHADSWEAHETNRKTLTESGHIKSWFNRTDSNGSGKISFSEFAVSDLNKGVSRPALKRVFDSLDSNQTGLLTLEQFTSYMTSGLHEKTVRDQRGSTVYGGSGRRLSEPSLSDPDKEFENLHTETQKNYVSRQYQSKLASNLWKRNNQKTDSLLKTLFDSTIPALAIRECTRLLKKSDTKTLLSMTDVRDGALDSDEEKDLHDEIDSLTAFQELVESRRSKSGMWWERQAAKQFNQLALHIVEVEHAFKLLYQVLCAALPTMQQPDADPIFSLQSISRALVALKSYTGNLDLDKCVEEVHRCMKPFKLLQTPKERRQNADEPSGDLRFSTLVSASSMFRDCILNMTVDKTLCHLMKSKLREFFNEDESKLLMANARLENLKAGELLFESRDKEVSDYKMLTVVLSGEVGVMRTLDEVEIGRGKCTVGCYFGGFKALSDTDGPPAHKEVPVKEGGTGVNNCVIKAETSCSVLRIPIANLRPVLVTTIGYKRKFFLNTMLEKIASDIENLENLNPLVLEPVNTSGDVGSGTWTNLDRMDDGFHAKHQQEQWKVPMTKRAYYSCVPELERQMIQGCFRDIQQLWSHVSRGANTIPKSSVELIKEFLGESGFQCYDHVFAPMEQPTAPAFFNAETFWFCWVKFLLTSISHAHSDDVIRDGNENLADADDTEHFVESDKERSNSVGKGLLCIIVDHAHSLTPMDTFTGKADPYVVVTVDGLSQRTKSRSGTLEPVWNHPLEFNATSNSSMVHIEVFDAETLSADRAMGNVSFIVPADPTPRSATYKLTGKVEDGRPAIGFVKLTASFVRGGKASTRIWEHKTEFELFCETENFREWLLWRIWPGRSIDKAFFQVPLPIHEREFTKAVGTLAVPLTGLAIKQYLTYLLVEHNYQINVYSCREFCGFFRRKLDSETSIAYRDIVKIVKERNSGVSHHDLFIGTALNQFHWMLRGWLFAMKLVSLYHLIVMPVRIGFRPWSSFYDMGVLMTDGLADICIFLHVVVLLNQAYMNSKSQWVTSRFRIFKNADWLTILAVVPFDWIVKLSGMSDDSAVWSRITKIFLLFSKIKPMSLVMSSRGNSISDLLFTLMLITHYAACVFYYLGDMVPTWKKTDHVDRISWLWADQAVTSNLTQYTYDREENFGTATGPIGEKLLSRYSLSVYWVVSTYTCQGVIGEMTPQNSYEIFYTIVLLLLNLTIWRWISGEIANMVMSSDARVIRTREEQDRILKFVSVRVFTDNLRDRLQAHFLAVQGSVSEEHDRLLSSLSHGLRVELARLIWRDFLTKVYLFRGCSGQFLDAICHLVSEQHFGPEQTIGVAGEVSDALVVLVQGCIECWSDFSHRNKKLTRKGSTVAPVSFTFGVRQYLHTRASRSGAVCMCLPREGIIEVLQIYPKDEDRLKRNALTFYAKEKEESSVAISGTATSFNMGDDSDNDSMESAKSAGTHQSGASHNSRNSRNSRISGNTNQSQRTTGSRSTIGSQRTRGSRTTIGSRGTKSTRYSGRSSRRGSEVSSKVSKSRAAEGQAEGDLIVDVSDAGGTPVYACSVPCLHLLCHARAFLLCFCSSEEMCPLQEMPVRMMVEAATQMVKPSKLMKNIRF